MKTRKVRAHRTQTKEMIMWFRSLRTSSSMLPGRLPRRGWYLVLLPILMVLFLHQPAWSESMSDAVNSLRKLADRCTRPISYQDYLMAFAETKLVAKRYLASSDALSHPKTAGAIDRILTHYEFARTVWEEKFSGDFLYLNTNIGQALWEHIALLYPESIRDQRDGGVLTTLPQGKAIYIPTMIEIIWQKAVRELNGIKPPPR